MFPLSCDLLFHLTGWLPRGAKLFQPLSLNPKLPDKRNGADDIGKETPES